MPEGILTHEQQDQAIIAEQTSVFWYSALGGGSSPWRLVPSFLRTVSIAEQSMRKQ